MTNPLLPRWLRVVSGVVLAVPVVGIGFLIDLLESPQFKTYLANVLTEITASLSTALVHTVVQAIFYGSA